MSWKWLAVISTALGLSVAVPAAQAAACFIDHAVRDGNAVKVVFADGHEPNAAITRADGSKIFINQALIKSFHPVKMVVQNPHHYVILHKGDELGIIGMDSGCTVTLVRVHGMLELKLHYGLPRIPGVKQHMFTDFVPIAGFQ